MLHGPVALYANCNCIYWTVYKLVNNCSAKYKPRLNTLLDEYPASRGDLLTLEELFKLAFSHCSLSLLKMCVSGRVIILICKSGTVAFAHTRAKRARGGA